MGESIKEIKGWLVDLYTYAVSGFAFLVNLDIFLFPETGKIYLSVFAWMGISAPTGSQVLLVVTALSAIAGVLTMPLYSLMAMKFGQLANLVWNRNLFSYDAKLFGFAKKHFEDRLKEKDLDEDRVLNLVRGALVHDGGEAAQELDEELAKDAMFRNLGYTFLIFGIAFYVRNLALPLSDIGWPKTEIILGLGLIYLHNFRMAKHTTNLALDYFASRILGRKAGRG
jgi:hypothetical protein